MCLCDINKVADLAQYEYTEVFKVFRKSQDGSLQGQFRVTFFERPRGQWLTCRLFGLAFTIRMGNGESYSAGWHSFEKREDAEAWCAPDCREVVEKVLIRKVVAVGSQTVVTFAENTATKKPAVVIVSEEMFIPLERE